MIMLLVVACQAPNQTYAPVVDGWRQQDKGDYYRVKAGDTLYAIAWYFDCDVRELAKMNHIAPPYIIHAGEKIYFFARTNNVSSQKSSHFPGKGKLAPKVASSERGTPLKIEQRLWLLPTQGTIMTHFDEQKLENKGIDIAGTHRQPIYASLDGKVVYNGNGLMGYGNLIIIKHSEEYLSAYANNDLNLVKEGEMVKRGQKIALMGKSGNQSPRLHFEIRYQGKPVNPTKYLNLT